MFPYPNTHNYKYTQESIACFHSSIFPQAENTTQNQKEKKEKKRK